MGITSRGGTYASRESNTSHLFQFSRHPLPSLYLRLALYSGIQRSDGGYTFRCIGMLGHGARRSAGSRRDIDLQCLLRSIATPITTEPYARLPLPSSHARPSFSHPPCVSFPLASRSLAHFLTALRHSLAITNTVVDVYILPFSSLLSSLFLF